MNHGELVAKILKIDQLHCAQVAKFCDQHPKTYVLNGSGCRADARLLDYALYRASVYLAVLSSHTIEPFGTTLIIKF